MRTEKLKTATDGNGNSGTYSTGRQMIPGQLPAQPYSYTQPTTAQQMPAKKKCGCSLTAPDTSLSSNDSPEAYYKRYYAQMQR